MPSTWMAEDISSRQATAVPCPCWAIPTAVASTGQICPRICAHGWRVTTKPSPHWAAALTLPTAIFSLPTANRHPPHVWHAPLSNQWLQLNGIRMLLIGTRFLYMTVTTPKSMVKIALPAALLQQWRKSWSFTNGPKQKRKPFLPMIRRHTMMENRKYGTSTNCHRLPSTGLIL